MKICPKCNIEQDDFSPSNFNRNGGQCRTCVKNYKKQYDANHTETIKAYQKKYSTQNKQNKSLYNSQYYTDNKSAIDAKKIQYRTLRKFSDPSFRLIVNCSSLIRSVLLRNGHSKNGKSILDFLPYSFEDLKIYLEKQFEPWMNWNNYGTYNSKTWNDNDSSTWVWQLDHIIPQSILKYTSMRDENFKKCWALDNLRPLSAKQNVIDGNRRNND